MQVRRSLAANSHVAGPILDPLAQNAGGGGRAGWKHRLPTGWSQRMTTMYGAESQLCYWTSHETPHGEVACSYQTTCPACL